MTRQQRDKLIELFSKYGSAQYIAGRHGDDFNKDNVDLVSKEFVSFLVDDIGVTYEKTEE